MKEIELTARLDSGRGTSVQRLPPLVDSRISLPKANTAVPASCAPPERLKLASFVLIALPCLVCPVTMVALTALKLAPALVERRTPLGPSRSTVLAFGASSAVGAPPPELRIDQVRPLVEVRKRVPSMFTA